jgi:hypothetical protein
MALNDKCRFIDGLCHFYHSTVFNTDQRTAIPYSFCQGGAEIGTYDPCYSGHGCSIIFGSTSPQTIDKQFLLPGNPGCAACFIGSLMDAGIGYLKLGGRGLPTQKNLQNIRFMKSVIELSMSGESNSEQIKALYTAIFGHPCNPGSCYYAEWMEAG